LKGEVSNIAVAVLAGGKNSRMSGHDKGFIQIGGKPIIARTIELLREIFKEIILVTNSPQKYKSYKKAAVIAEDIIKGAGPLSGIHCALSVSGKEAVFFVACDMPFLHNALIRQQTELFAKIDCDCLVPRIGSCVEPLHAIYKKNLKDNIYAFLKDSRDYSIRSFLKTINVYYWDLENSRLNKRMFKNVNTKEDLLKVRGYHEGKVKSLA